MKERLYINKLLLSAFCWLVAGIGAIGQSTVTTDKNDYFPGEYVIITGTGWQSDDSVRLNIAHLDPLPEPLHTHEAWYVIPDSLGNIYYKWYVMEQELGTSLKLEALGNKTGNSAMTYFTDDRTGFSSAVIIGAPVTICSGTIVSLGLNVATCNSNGGSGIYTASYQWQQSIDNSNWNGAPGISTNLTYSASPNSNTFYRCIITVTGTYQGCGIRPNDPPYITASALITVNPSPLVNSASTGTICSGISQNYVITSAVAGTTFIWSRAEVQGISNPAVSGQTTNTITESLVNTTSTDRTVTYVITPTANGCSGSPFNYVVTVRSVPHISGPLSAYAGTAGYVYSTESGKTNYNWTISSGGAISSGQNTNQIEVTWNTAGPQTVSVSYDVNNGCSGTVTNNILIYPYPTVNFEIVKSQVFPSPTAPGNLVTYTISYLNTSPNSATNVVIIDTLPPSSLFTYKTIDPSGTYNPSVPSISWNIGIVPPNGSGYVTVTGYWGRLGPVYSYNPTSYYTSSGSSINAITNRATILSDQSPLGIAAPIVSAVVPQTCGSIFPDGNNSFKQGENKIVYYPMTILNTGNIYDNYTLTVPSSVFANSGNLNELRLRIVDINHNPISLSGWIPPGGSFSFMLELDGTSTTRKPQAGDIFNIVVTSLSTVCNTSATATLITTTYNGSPTGPDILVTKTSSVGSYTVGSGPITYTITVANVGTSDASNVVLTDYLPINADPPNSTDISDAGTRSGFTVTWPAMNIGAGELHQYTVKIYPSCLSAPSLINKAEVVYPGDVDASNNTSTISTPVILTGVTPVPSTNTPVVCTNNSVVLTATGATSNEIYRWYTTATEVIPFASGSPITTPILNATQTFYVSIYNSITSCESYRSSITITVNPIPTVSVTPSSQAICSGNPSSIALTSNVTGASFTWTAEIHTSPTGGTITGYSNCNSGCGTSITQTLTNTGTTAGVVRYTITPTANGCTGTPVIVDIVVNPLPVTSPIFHR